MNRTNDPEFFALWDMEQSLTKKGELPLQPKEQLELQILEAAFFDKAGYLPAYQGYQAAIENYNKNQ